MTCGAPTEAALFTRGERHHLSADLPPPPSLTAVVTLFPHCRHFVFPYFSPAATLFSRSFSLTARILRRPSSVSPLSPTLLPYLCVFLSEWCRHSVLRTHSSPWQQQLPDKRKQIPQPDTDINGLACFFFFSSLLFSACQAFFCHPASLFWAAAFRQASFTVLGIRNSNCRLSDCAFKFLAGTPGVKVDTFQCLCLSTSFNYTDSEGKEINCIFDETLTLITTVLHSFSKK